MTLHRFAVRIMVRPFLWAHMKERQTFLTRTIRTLWRAL